MRFLIRPFYSDHFHRAFWQGFKECFAILFDENPVIQHDDNASVGFRANQPAHPLSKFQNRLRQRVLRERIAALRD